MKFKISITNFGKQLRGDITQKLECSMEINSGAVFLLEDIYSKKIIESILKKFGEKTIINLTPVQ